MRTLLMLAALAVAGAALLAGCGDDATSAGASSSPTPMPSFSVSTSVPAEPSPTPSNTPSKTPTPSATPSSSSAAPTQTPSASSSPTEAPGGVVHTYKNLTLRLPVADDAVPDAPAGFVAYAREALEQDWKRLGGTPGCKRGAVITVSATRSDGFAYVMRDVDPSLQSCPNAANVAGGYRAVWKDDGGWKEVLGMQDVPACSDFEKYDVPSALLGMDAQCLKGNKVVPYEHP
ncbi:hypothetical protein [Nocardioides sp. KR10-350]|uniref:hypothetical protein n=1 Tax=Nocardioides cheoyonin TaxID=3156615 RepID=UPI0032B4ADA8